MCCNAEQGLVAAIHSLEQQNIKGLGPAVANILYFLHPTLIPPFNTAIVNGYNRLTGARVRLGRWGEYLAMRGGILKFNEEHRDLLSNDLGAIAGLLFDIGSGRYVLPLSADDVTAKAAWEKDVEEVRAASKKLDKSLAASQAGEQTHTEVQGWLRDLGLKLGYAVWVAANDRNKVLDAGRLSDGCLESLPTAFDQSPSAEAVRLIDVLWLEPSTGRVAAAFEVEHTTSIYSGIVRLLDLALGGAANATNGLFLVAPDGREDEVRGQLRRPAFSRVADLRVRYLRYSDLRANREAMARFGHGLKPIEALAKSL